MGPVLDRLFVAAVLGGPLAWVVWGWRSWLRARPEDLTLGLMCSLAGFALASLSASLEIGTGMYAQFVNIPFMDPRLLRIYAVGLISALLGLLSSLFGMGKKGPLRWKAPAMSLVLLCFDLDKQ